MMQIHPATPSDAPEIATLFLTAFSNSINLAMFPRTPDVQAWWEATFRTNIEHMQQGKPIKLLKIVEPSAQNEEKEGKIVAFALWKLPEEKNAEPSKEDIQLPASANKDLCMIFFTAMVRNKEKYMSSRPHYYLDIIATHPAHEGRGLASQLLCWGLEKADNEGLPTFLCASPAGRVVYEKRGFQLAGMEDLTPYYKQAYMVREPANTH